MSKDPMGMQERDELKALGFEVPDSVTPIVAYRSWQMLTGTGLFSHNGTPWTGGEVMEAVCPYGCGKGRKHPHHLFDPYKQNGECSCPCEPCSCGVYAAKAERARVLVPSGRVYGEVYLWGRILEGPRGYRAEFCYPKKFFVRDRVTKRQLEALGFGVPVEAGGGYYPFVRSQTSLLDRLGTDIGSILLLFNGVPALALAVFTTVTQDMSKASNQLSAALLYAVGFLALGITWMSRHLAKQLGGG